MNKEQFKKYYNSIRLASKEKLFRFSRMWAIHAGTNLSTLDKKDLAAEWTWIAEPDACPACQEWDGWTMTLEMWLMSAIPGKPNGMNVAGDVTDYETEPYGTFCENNCRCILRKVSPST